jgi:hypothetical protein
MERTNNPATTKTANSYAPKKRDESSSFFQRKLTVGPSNDKYEQEADAVAEKVVQSKSEGNNFFKPTISTLSHIQRKCAACEEEEKQIQRKESGSNVSDHSSSSLISEAVGGRGNAMDYNTRSYMEDRFGYNFSDVKIHTGSVAAKSADAINAHAYTTSNNIVFNNGKYNPETTTGKQLLAHELTHVIQQKSANPSSTYVQRESVYEDVATVNPGHAGGIYSGTVNRYEYNDRAAYNTRIANNRTNTIHRGSVNVRFDSNTCVLEVPVSMQFVNHTAGINTSCGDISGRVNDPVRPVSASAFASTVTHVMSSLQSGINNWYKVRLGNPTPTGCTASEIPIRVILTQVAANPDYTIVITGNDGRSYVRGNQMVMCGSDASDSDIIIHEGGHFILGHGDEYHESTAARPRSRERLGQYSRMAQDAPPRLLEFYERHFNFASEFMNTTFPGCQASLTRGSQGGRIEIAPYLSVGVMSTSLAGNYAFLSLGTQFGIPLTTMRRLSLMIGPNLNLVGLGTSFSSPTQISALMLGVRAGLNYRTGIGYAGGSWSFNAGIYGEGGGLMNFADRPGGLPNRTVTPYAEASATLGLSIDSRFTFGAEAARGVIAPSSPNPNIDYYRVGLRMALSF